MKTTLLLCALAAAFSLSAQDGIQWRGDRTGVYKETGLLKQWPAEGPALLWHFDGLGNGYSSVSIHQDQLYVTGYQDQKGYLYVLGTDGKLRHKVMYGAEWDSDGYVGARSTVMHDDGKLYVVSGLAELSCFDAGTMKRVWQKDYRKDYGAENTKHGWNGPPLIVGEKLIIAPGGTEHNVVALDKATGTILWSSPGKGDMSGYGTPVFVADQQVPQVVVMMAHHIIGLDVKDGKLLWSHPHTNRFGEHPNTPVYSDGMLFCTSSYGKGSVMLRLTDGGRGVQQVWELKELSHKTGHVMKVGGNLYGSGDRANWYCVDWHTGVVKHTNPVLGAGTIVAADGLLYCYSEKGEMALVKPEPAAFEIVSTFPVTLGTEQHWAHPVIHRGVLYVRHGDTLMAYKIN